MWQLETQLFASSYIGLAYIFEASYSTLVTSSEKTRSIRTREIGGVTLSDVLANVIEMLKNRYRNADVIGMLKNH